jgi:hypothetical protein
MKIGQLVMLIRTAGILPPTGATGVIHTECCCSDSTRVMFANHKDTSWKHADGAFCVKKAWLVKLDDPDAVKSVDDQLELDIGGGETMPVKDLAKIARRMLEDLEEEDA